MGELKRACQRVEFWYRRTTRHVIQAIMTRPRSSKLQRANTSVLSSQNFNTEHEYDWVQVVDPSGTHLSPKMFGSSIPPHSPGWRSKSNIIHVKFHTDSSEQRSGWRMAWTETEDKA